MLFYFIRSQNSECRPPPASCPSSNNTYLIPYLSLTLLLPHSYCSSLCVHRAGSEQKQTRARRSLIMTPLSTRTHSCTPHVCAHRQRAHQSVLSPAHMFTSGPSPVPVMNSVSLSCAGGIVGCVCVCGGGGCLSLSYKTIKSEILPHPASLQWPAVTATDTHRRSVCV